MHSSQAGGLTREEGQQQTVQGVDNRQTSRQAGRQGSHTRERESARQAVVHWVQKCVAVAELGYTQCLADVERHESISVPMLLLLLCTTNQPHSRLT